MENKAMNYYEEEDKRKALRNLADTVETYKKLIEDFDDLRFDSVLVALDNIEDCCKDTKKEVDACIHRVLVTMNVDIVVDVLAAVDEDEDLILDAADREAYNKLASGDYQNEATDDRSILTQLSGDECNDTTV
tara:strand:+ start:650 stop:1048 length:399 start_codon:yes stop_codon:yes gene_type:complete